MMSSNLESNQLIDLFKIYMAEKIDQQDVNQITTNALLNYACGKNNSDALYNICLEAGLITDIANLTEIGRKLLMDNFMKMKSDHRQLLLKHEALLLESKEVQDMNDIVFPDDFLFKKVFYYEDLPIEIRETLEEGLSELWIPMMVAVPSQAGKYEIYRPSCDKIHYCQWNNTGWAYDHDQIAFWRPKKAPLKKKN